MFPCYAFDYNKRFDGGREGYIGEGGSKSRQEGWATNAAPIGFAVSASPMPTSFGSFLVRRQERNISPHSARCQSIHLLRKQRAAVPGFGSLTGFGDKKGTYPPVRYSTDKSNRSEITLHPRQKRNDPDPRQS